MYMYMYIVNNGYTCTMYIVHPQLIGAWGSQNIEAYMYIHTIIHALSCMCHPKRKWCGCVCMLSLP